MRPAAEGKCSVCGRIGSFMIKDNATLFREAACGNCGASKRTSDVARAVVRTLTGNEEASLAESLTHLKGMRIYEAAARGRIHDLLKRLPHYVCSEYFDDVPRGRSKGGVRCEDLEQLTFPDNRFDLVITEDVLEHVPDPHRAFREIRRVLKPGGCHIFTVPLHEGKKTVTRAALENDNVVHLMPPVYHGDPLRAEGALVYTDFGDDTATMLNAMDMHTEIVTASRWYTPEELSFIDKDALYGSYLEHLKTNDLVSFFKYNSVVFISKKSLYTDERYMPDFAAAQMSYEHWHRYLYASGFVAGKTVLDVACGAGYGSDLLAQSAQSVIGVDISQDAISRAAGKYIRSNLEFRRGSAAKIPVEENAYFDVAVSFETIEHLAEDAQESFLSEVKRLLKQDGLFIISTPDKRAFSDIPQHRNEFHLKEFYIDEFKTFLSRFFKTVHILGHKIYPVSYIWNTEGEGSGCAEYRIEHTADGFRPTTQPKSPLFVVAVCSDGRIPAPEASVMVDVSERLLRDKDLQLEELKNSWSWRVTAPLRWVARAFMKKGG